MLNLEQSELQSIEDDAFTKFRTAPYVLLEWSKHRLFESVVKRKLIIILLDEKKTDINRGILIKWSFFN
jgi:hypothetical protein